MPEVRNEIIVNAEDLTPEIIAGLDDKARADIVASFIAASIEIRQGIKPETKNKPKTRTELEAEIKLFESLANISGFLSKIIGGAEGRVYASRLHSYQARKEELEERIAVMDNPSLAKDETGSIAEAIRGRMRHQYRTVDCQETLESEAA